jgi:hypothetical protein
MKPTAILFASILLTACFEMQYDTAAAEYEPKIAVEGWIESGSYPFVLLSRSVSFEHNLDTAYLLDHAIRSAKVTVSDGVVSETLTLGSNSAYLPPYVYYGYRLKGETGKNYTLRIEYGGQVITATTTINPPVAIDESRFEATSPYDTAGYIYIRFRNTSDAYYQVATMTDGAERVFTPCLFGNIAAANYAKGESIELQLNKGPSLTQTDGIDFNTTYIRGDRVHIKLRTQSRDSYLFFTSRQDEILNAFNPIFPAHTNLKTNISGGIGYWSGFGVFETVIETTQ